MILAQLLTRALSRREDDGPGSADVQRGQGRDNDKEKRRARTMGVRPETERHDGLSEVKHADWAGAIPDRQWQVYEPVLAAALARKLRFALGGAFALAAYCRYWRNTKDLDLYVLPEDVPTFKAVLDALGVQDYHGQLAYDRRWIYRGHVEDTIVDVIWAMANQRAQVDEQWLDRGPTVLVRGIALRVIPAEELIWAKLYVLQRPRCDWPDLFNILYANATKLDWLHLLDRIGPDTRLFAGLLSSFSWMCPGSASAFPGWIWERLGIAPPGPSDEAVSEERVRLLDATDWFFPLIR